MPLAYLISKLYERIPLPRSNFTGGLFLYPIRLRMAVIIAAGFGGLSEEEASDLHEYLKNL